MEEKNLPPPPFLFFPLMIGVKELVVPFFFFLNMAYREIERIPTFSLFFLLLALLREVEVLFGCLFCLSLGEEQMKER